jgi:type VI secretion system protein ImpK
MIKYPSKNMIDACEPVFLLLNQIRTSTDLGDTNALRNHVISLLDEMEKQAKKLGFTSEEIEVAKYALIVSTDEKVLHSSWAEKDEWSNEPLQLQFFGNNTGGVEFFNRLETIRKSEYETTDLLEVYYLCLVLGFEGKFRILGSEKLGDIIFNIREDLKIKSGQVKELSPSWKQPVAAAKEKKQRLPGWVVIPAAAILVGVLAFLVFSLLISGETRDAASKFLSL